MENESHGRQLNEFIEIAQGIELIFDQTDQWLWDLDLRNQKLTIIGNWSKHIGIDPKLSDGNGFLEKLSLKLHMDERVAFDGLLLELMKGNRSRFEARHRFVDVHGDEVWVRTRIVCQVEAGQIVRLIGSHTDVDDYFDTVEKLEQLAYIDPITGLQNRNALIAHLENHFWNYDREHMSGSILLLGLDHFKYANSTYGHYVGDRILKQVGQMLKDVPVEADAFCARYESDHFCIVINQTDEDLVCDYADRILKTISKGIRVGEESYNLTVSIGISIFPLHGTSYDELFKNAESALGVSKASGKNKLTIYEYSMNVQLIERWTLTQELLCAIDHDELRLVFQPIMNLRDNRIVGFEALVRWHNNKLGLVPPNRFIPLAEEIGVINAIDYFVLKQALAAIKRLNEKYGLDLYMAVNISSGHLTEKQFVQNVDSILKDLNMTPKWLRIEITEHALISSISESQLALKRLKDMGVQVYLDDFGTGYSSFNYLKNLPVDVVKLDMSFIADLLRDPQSEKLIEGIIQLAHILNLKICAEGIEELMQAETLRKLGCDFGQGYYYSKPVEEERLCILIDENS